MHVSGADCPERDFRAGLSEEEFWDHVLAMISGPESADDPDPDQLPLELTPCPICGESAACGYDGEGRAFIHALGPEFDADSDGSS